MSAITTLKDLDEEFTDKYQDKALECYNKKDLVRLVNATSEASNELVQMIEGNNGRNGEADIAL